MQEKLADEHSKDCGTSETRPEQSDTLAVMQQTLQAKTAALEAAHSVLSSTQQEVLVLAQGLEAAQADVAGLKVMCGRL